MQQFGDPKRVILCVRWYDSQPPKISGCPDTLTLNAKLFQTARKPTKVGSKTQAGRRCPNVVRQFDITSEPIPSENEAHCGILSSTDVQTRGYVNQLRAILVRLASRRGAVMTCRYCRLDQASDVEAPKGPNVASLLPQVYPTSPR